MIILVGILAFPLLMAPTSIFECSIAGHRSENLPADLYANSQFDEIQGACSGDGNDADLCRECSGNFTANFPLSMDDVRRSLVPGLLQTSYVQGNHFLYMLLEAP